MIPDDFYRRKNIVSRYFGANIKHYPQRKDIVFPVVTKDYILQQGDNFLSLAERIFGSENTGMWVLLAEINTDKPVDDWQSGDTIRIPEKIVPYYQDSAELLQPAKPSKYIKRKKSFTTTQVQACAVPSAISAAEIMTTAINYHWSGGSNVVYYVYQYKETSSLVWSDEIVTFINDVTIYGLTPATLYDFRVKAICTYDGESTWASLLETPTMGYSTCNAVGVLSLDSYASNNATFSFTDPTPGDAGFGYEVHFKTTAASTWTVLFILPAITPFILHGLLSNQEYQVKMRRICARKDTDDGTFYYSTFSNIVTFTTYASCGVTSDLILINRGSTFIKVSWTAGAGNASYLVSIYKDNVLIDSDTVSATDHEFSGLTASSTYKITVVGICEDSSAPDSSVLIVSTTSDSCPVVDIIALEELPGTNGTPKRRRIRVICLSPASSIDYAYNYYIDGNLVLSNTLFTDIILELDDPTWVLTQATIGIETVCGVSFVSPVKTGVIMFTQPDPAVIICPLPGVEVSNITSDGASAKFAVNDIVVTEVEYSVSVTGTGVYTAPTLIAATPANNPIALSGLLADTDYTIRIRSKCTAEYSGYIYSTFRTLPDGGFSSCTAPTFMAIDGVTQSTAMITWTFGVGIPVPANVTAFILRLTRVLDNFQSEISVGLVTSYELTGLSSDSAYTVELKSQCSGEVGESQWTSPVLSFTTNAAEGGGGGGDIK